MKSIFFIKYYFLITILSSIAIIGFFNTSEAKQNFAVVHQKIADLEGNKYIPKTEVNTWKAASAFFTFSWGVPNSYTRRQLITYNPEGVHATHVNIVNIDQEMSSGGVAPDLNIIEEHPDWFLYNKDGSKATYFKNDRYRMDIGNEEYVEFAIKWIRNMLSGAYAPHNAVGIDSGMFYRADPEWMKYDADEEWQQVWLNFLKKIRTELSPEYKIILNSGNSDRQTFSRMLKCCDGCILEFFCVRNSKILNKDHILSWMQKGEWCEKNQKICVLRDVFQDRHSVPDTPLGYGAFLLIYSGYSYYCIDSTDNTTLYFRSMFVDAGEPLSAFRIAENGIFYRKFENLIVLVNLNSSKRNYSFSREYYTLGGAPVFSAEVGANTARIFTVLPFKKEFLPKDWKTQTLERLDSESSKKN